MKLPAPGVYWIDAAGIAILAIMTAGLHVAFIAPTLDLKTREGELQHRLIDMRSNLAALRTRNRDFEGRVAEARQVVDAQPTLEPSDALLTRRAALTSLLSEHNLLLDEFKSESAEPAPRRGQAPPEPSRERSFVRHALVLSGEGAFPDVVAMVSELRHRFSDMLIEAIEVGGHPFASSDLRQFTVKVVWYASPQ